MAGRRYPGFAVLLLAQAKHCLWRRFEAQLASVLARFGHDLRKLEPAKVYGRSTQSGRGWSGWFGF
jgi:hypothetical protein